MSRLRVVLAGACPFPTGQGSQVYVRGMARALVAAGADVTVVVYGHGDPEGDTDTAADGRRGEPGYRLVRLPRVPGYRRVRSGPDLVKPALDLALAARLTRVAADVLVAHNVEALAAALVARAWSGAPVVYAAHTLLGEELPSYLPPARAALAPAVARAGAAADRLLAPRADLSLALSPAGEAALRGLGCRVALHPPGLDPADFAGVVPRRLAGEGRPVVVYAGNVDGYQDLPLLARAAAAAPDLRVVVVGPDEPPDGLEHVAARRWPDVAAWVAGGDAAVVPRSRCAGLPVKLGNALALGVPVVVADAGAQGLAGEIPFRAGDLRSLVAALRRAVVAPRPSAAAVLAARGWAAAGPRLVAELAAVAERQRTTERQRATKPVTGVRVPTFQEAVRRTPA